MTLTVIPIANGALGTIPKVLVNGLGNHRMSEDHPDYNTEKIPGDIRGLALTQTPLKNHYLTLELKTVKKV